MPDVNAVHTRPLPSTQTAMVISAPGGPEVLTARTVTVPVPGDSEILIEIAFAGINRHDCNQRRRGPAPPQSDIPGLEVSGVVRETGARVPKEWIGRRVCALVDGGGYAHYVTAPAGVAFALDERIALQQAAALPEAMFTLWHNFFNVARLGPGETVLIHGGTSGVGSLAIQVLARLGHAVYATCGTDAKCAQALALGAKEAFNYRASRFEDDIARCTQGRGVDVILDMAGAKYAARNVAALARRGRIVHLSPGDNESLEVPLRPLMAREAKITGSLLRPLPIVEKIPIADDMRRVILPMVVSGDVKPLLAGILPLSEAAEAHRRMESGDLAGKLLLQAADARRLTDMDAPAPMTRT